MRHWDLNALDAPTPAVLHSREGEGRAVLIVLGAGEELGEHEVREAAFVLVVDGEARVEAGDEWLDARAGELLRFDPHERHTVTTASGVRLLLVLAPWPAEGHYAPEESLRTSA